LRLLRICKTTMPLINIFAGAALLLFGRRLFWLFVAGVGFVVGMMLATDWFGEKSALLTVLIGAGVGVIGAILSVLLQRVVITVAGFLSGGYLAYTLTLALTANHESLGWIAFLIGGVVGAILVAGLFDWALIGLSALTGATVIARNIAVNQSMSALLFFVLLVFGIIVQTRQLAKAPTAPGKE
jgi:MFS family permease